MHRYATIGAVLMSEKVADVIRCKGRIWKHGHTYQVGFFSNTLFDILTWATGAPDRLCCVFGRSKSR